MNDLLIVLLCLVALLMCRNTLVFRMHTRRIEEIHTHNTKMIDAGRFDDIDFGEYDRVGHYERDMLDLRKWTYRQFYPEALS